MSEFTDLITISQMTPGPIAVNSATFVGLRVAGYAGAAIATLIARIVECVINGHSQAVSEISQAGCSSGFSWRYKTGCCGYDRVSGSFDIGDGGLDWYRYDKSRRN